MYIVHTYLFWRDFVVSKTLVFEIYKSTSAKKKQKPILVNTGTNTLNMANVATNTMTTKELLAPLASMEDLSVCMTPMSTPGASPRTRARWSQRSSTGSQFDPFVTSPLITDQNGQSYGVNQGSSFHISKMSFNYLLSLIFNVIFVTFPSKMWSPFLSNTKRLKTFLPLFQLELLKWLYKLKIFYHFVIALISSTMNFHILIAKLKI